MTNINELAGLLSQELNKYGNSELEYSRNLFSGKLSEKATISGSISGLSYKVLMFDASNESGIPSVSAHFSINVNGIGFSEKQMAFWNADNRFTKLYQQDEDEAFLVLDSFLPSSDEGHLHQSIARVWSMAVCELRKLKSSCERRGIF
ncbi:hypothetical protein [Belnapia rosea]|uniref:hypothetical protein n=1 Tax=Belnapia rosea TaxID=938405 RepID=UPI00115F7856|nr:hypothetical protein [Belnapia rosea]